MSFPIYAYYDGYEDLWEEEREVVRYVVLGEVDPGLVGICYVGELKHLATIGQRTHAKAWIDGSLTTSEVRAFLRESCHRSDRTLEECRAKVDALLTEQEPSAWGTSSSVWDGYWGVGFHWDRDHPYPQRFAEALQRKIRLLELRETWLMDKN